MKEATMLDEMKYIYFDKWVPEEIVMILAFEFIARSCVAAWPTFSRLSEVIWTELWTETLFHPIQKEVFD